MFLSIVFVFVLLGTAAGMVLYPKIEKPISGVRAIIVSAMLLSCCLALAAWAGGALQKRVGIGAPLLVMAVLLVLLWGGIYKKRNVQRLRWDMVELVGVVLVIFVVCGVSFHVFTASLSVRYSNAVGAEQFLAAIRLLRGETGVEQLSFQAYLEALAVGLAAPFLTTAQCYKAFIAAEIVMHLLEAGMFCVVVYTISDKKIMRYGAPVLCGFYFLGYPSLSILWANYEYWSGNAGLLLFGVYMFLVVEKSKKMPRRVRIGLALLGSVVLAVALFYEQISAGLSDAAVSELHAEGMYRCMYGDVIFLLPTFFFVLACLFVKKKGFVSISIISVVMLIEAIVLYVLWYNSLLDTYYYFWNYYNLWVIGWILAAAALGVAADTGQLPICLSYAAMMLALGILTWTDYDGAMMDFVPNYNQPGITQNYFALFRQTAEALRLDYEVYEVPDEVLEAMVYVAENEDIEVSAVPTENESLLYWHEAFTESEGQAFWLEKEEFPDVIKNLAEADVDAIVVMKKSETYENYKDYFEQCTVVLDKEEVVVYTPDGESWDDLSGMDIELAEEKQELFSWIEANLTETVPLMAEQGAYMDYILYQNIVGYSARDFYTWHYTPRGNVENLNEHGVHYVVLLYGEEYYESTQYYFDRFEEVFENEAGKIIRCDGREWTTQY